jgi:hypothetical protein
MFGVSGGQPVQPVATLSPRAVNARLRLASPASCLVGYAT